MGFGGFFSKFSWPFNNNKEENDQMKYFRQRYEEQHKKTRDLEKEVNNSKRDERLFLVSYQRACDHESLTRNSSKQEQTQSFNDFYARCDCCKAEVFNQSRTINYFNTTIDLLSRLPKAMEALKVAGVVDLKDVQCKSDIDNTYDIARHLTDMLSLMREKASSLPSNQFDGKIQARFSAKKKEDNPK